MTHAKTQIAPRCNTLRGVGGFNGVSVSSNSYRPARVHGWIWRPISNGRTDPGHGRQPLWHDVLRKRQSRDKRTDLRRAKNVPPCRSHGNPVSSGDEVTIRTVIRRVQAGLRRHTGQISALQEKKKWTLSSKVSEKLPPI